MNRLLLAVCFMFGILRDGHGQASEDPAALLAAAKASLGISGFPGEIKSLDLSGDFVKLGDSRVPGPKPGDAPVVTDTTGKIFMAFAKPNAFRRDFESNIAGQKATWLTGTGRIDSRFWQIDKPGVIAAGTLTSRNSVPLSEANLESSVMHLQARYLFSLLLTATTGYPLSFRVTGQEVVADKLADVVEATGPDNVRVSLFISQVSHRPVKLSYGVGLPAHTEEVFFSNYQRTSGVSLPHLFSRYSGGRLVEEWHIANYTINSDRSPVGVAP